MNHRDDAGETALHVLARTISNEIDNSNGFRKIWAFNIDWFKTALSLLTSKGADISAEDARNKKSPLRVFLDNAFEVSEKRFDQAITHSKALGAEFGSGRPTCGRIGNQRWKCHFIMSVLVAGSVESNEYGLQILLEQLHTELHEGHLEPREERYYEQALDPIRSRSLPKKNTDVLH
ncbi:Uu.00g141700.m01.CDS01 [Anthostomella pinea]|uniref:Uu.00g141700.m01.CDS01 n=1 Tax=Anthostomella pinea TaxID=933095 RepID=A0AAI8VQZ9_9PEZI|nr:Uu.00g141700.m01.CDS01 [Anthostomella pinea]